MTQKWYQRATVQAALVGGFFLVVAAIVAAIISGLFTLSANKQTVEEPQVIFQEVPQVRFTYYSIEGSTLLDQALRGSLFSPFDGFAFNPNWLKNEVYEDLKKILAMDRHQRWADEMPYDVMDVFASDARGKKVFYQQLRSYALEGESSDSLYEMRRRQFYGAGGPFRGRSNTGKLDVDEFLDLVRSQPTWTISVPQVEELDEDKPIPWDRYTIFGLLEPRSALRYTRDPVSREILKSRPDLKDIVFLRVYASHHGDFYGFILIRELKILVMGIENVGHQPIGLDKIRQKSIIASGPFDVRTDSDQQAQMTRAVTKERPLPIEMLLPGEHLLVPLRLELGFASSLKDENILNYEFCIERDDLPTRWWSKRAEDPIVFEVLRGVDTNWNAVTSRTAFDKSRFMSKVDFSEFIEDTYYLGSAIDVEEVVFKTGTGVPTAHEVRQFDPYNLVARGGYAKGSCPILYVQDQGDWLRIRPVLEDAVTRSRKSTDRVVVSGDNSVFLLAEEEAETSFIDAIHLEIRDEAGKTWSIRPRGLKELNEEDGIFITLEKGENFVLRFDIPEAISKETMRELVFSGFYVPHTLLSSLSSNK